MSIVNPVCRAQSVVTAFQHAVSPHASTIPLEEEVLFRALGAALAASGAAAHYLHGRKSRVAFDGLEPFSKHPAHCELCDLLIVAFSINQRVARMTFLQAKRHIGPLPHAGNRTGCTCIDSFSFNADTTQWLLLASRPQLRPTHRKFVPPADLLSSARCPSIGSFGIFSNTNGIYDFLFVSADMLHPRDPLGARHGKGAKRFASHDCAPCVRRQFGCFERVYARSLVDFAFALHRLEIGEPITVDTGIRPASPADVLSQWLSEQVEVLLTASTPDAQANPTLRALRDLLPERRTGANSPRFMSDPLPMLVVQTDEGR
jgi:hypothetical protein